MRVGPTHAEGGERVDLAAVATGHDRGRLKLLVRVLLADAHGDDVGRARLAQQLEQHDLFLQRLQHRLDRGLELRRRNGSGWASRPRPSGWRPRCSSISSRVAIAAWPITASEGGSSSASRLSRTAAWEDDWPTAAAFRCARNSASVSSSARGSRATRCSIRPVEVIRINNSREVDSETSSTCRTVEWLRVGYCTMATCWVTWASSRTVRCSTSSRSSAPDRKVWMARCSAADSGLHRAQPVDEQPVALVGRDPAGAGVRLGDVALFLQRGHVVADGGRGDAQIVLLDQSLGPDGFLAGDVVGDDRAQHLELAVVHVPSSGSGPISRIMSARRRILALAQTECAV